MKAYAILDGSGVWHIVMSLLHGAYTSNVETLKDDCEKPRYRFPLSLTLRDTQTRMSGVCSTLVRSCKWSKKPNEFCELGGTMSWGVPLMNEADAPEYFTARFDLRRHRGSLAIGPEGDGQSWRLKPNLTFTRYPEVFDFAASLFGAFAQTGNLEEGLCDRLPLYFGNDKGITHVAEITEMRRIDLRVGVPWGFAGRMSPGTSLYELHENGTVPFKGVYDFVEKTVEVELLPLDGG